jgi:hypothetical protein
MSLENDRRPDEYVVGDLVSLIPTSTLRVGIVTEVSYLSISAATSCKVFWLKEGIVSNHSATHLELVYNKKR